MKIAGFGDSFIEDNIDGIIYEPGYSTLVSKHFNAEYKSFGLGGSGSHYSFFKFLEFGKDYDVILFVWSNSLRFYNKSHPNICPASSYLNKNSDDPIWQAANMYYQYLFDEKKVEIEFESFYYWLDTFLYKNYPNKKFIHMWGFPKIEYEGNCFEYWKNKDNISYYHKFANSAEIRPALINLSINDQWPANNDLSNEKRINHLTENMHKLLSEKIIYAIDNYKPGLLVE